MAELWESDPVATTDEKQPWESDPIAEESPKSSNFLFDPEVAQNLRGAIQDTASGVAQGVAQLPKMAYQGLKFVVGGPEEKAKIGEQALTEAKIQGQQMASDLQSPATSREFMRGVANVGLMAAPALGEIAGEAGLLGRAKPPIQTLREIATGEKPPIQVTPRTPEAPVTTVAEQQPIIPEPKPEEVAQEPIPVQAQPETVPRAGETAPEAIAQEVAPVPAEQPQISWVTPETPPATSELGSKLGLSEPTAFPDLAPEEMQFSQTPEKIQRDIDAFQKYNSDYRRIFKVEGDDAVTKANDKIISRLKEKQAGQGTEAQPSTTDAIKPEEVGATPETPPTVAETVPAGTGKAPTTTAQDIQGFFKTAKNAATDSYIDNIWGKVQEGKPIQRIAPLENALREAQKLGQIKTREDVARIFKEQLEPAPAAKAGDMTMAEPLPKEAPAEAVKPTPVSTKNEYTEAQRADRGLPEAEQAAKRGFGKVWDEAASEAEKDPTIGRRLVEEINAKPRPISDTENAHLLRQEIAAQKEHSTAIDAVNSAKTPEDLTAAKSRLELARTDLQNVYDATKSAGTKGGQALSARKMLANEDYSLGKMEARRRAANDGAPLNENQLSETKALHDKISDLQSKLDAHEVAATFEKEFSKLVDESRKEAKVAKSTGTKFTDFLDRKADEARVRITERRGRLTTGFDPSSITDEAVIGASHIAKGLTKFADWSVEMAKEFGDQIRPFLKDLWDRSRAFHDANAREYGDKALSRYKTYLGKQAEQIKSKLEAGDFTKAQRQKTQLDKEAFNMRADLQKLKNEFERGVAKEAYQKKTPAQKFWDHFVGFERGMKLSGPEVFGKLGVAAAVREVLAPIEAAGGYGVSKVFPKLAAGTKFGADLGVVVRSEIKAKAALFTKGMKDAWQNVKGQETGLEAIGGKNSTRPDFWYNRIGKMHAAIKAPVKRAEFTRSLELRMDSAIKNGEDINHPEVMTRLANESVMDSNRAIFQDKSVVSGFFSMLERSSPAAGRVARFLFPVVKIPVNIFKELVNLHVGAPVGAARIGAAYWKGVETLPSLQREAIIRQLTKGSIGGAGLLWGYYNRDKVRNFFDHAPTWFHHTPMAMVLNEGSYLKGIAEGGEKAKQSIKELKYMAKTDIPFMYTIKDIGDALDAHNSHAFLGWINNMTQSTVVPQILTQTAKQIDKPGTFPLNIGEKPIYRPSTNPLDAIKLGIPGVRQTVSEKATKPKVSKSRDRLR